MISQRIAVTRVSLVRGLPSGTQVQILQPVAYLVRLSFRAFLQQVGFRACFQNDWGCGF